MSTKSQSFLKWSSLKWSAEEAKKKDVLFKPSQKKDQDDEQLAAKIDVLTVHEKLPNMLPNNNIPKFGKF